MPRDNYPPRLFSSRQLFTGLLGVLSLRRRTGTSGALLCLQFDTDTRGRLRVETADDPDLKAMLATVDMVVQGMQAFSIINVLPWMDFIPGPMPWRTVRKMDEEVYSRLTKEATEGRRRGLDT